MTDDLTDKRYLVVVIRLLVDHHGKVERGVLIDAGGETIGQFQQLDNLPHLITYWLESWSRQQSSTPG